MTSGYFELAETSYLKAHDYNSLLLFYSSVGDIDGLKKLMEEADSNGKYNVAMEAAFLIGDAQRCLNILLKQKKVAEAAMFARAYAPSLLPSVMK